jgi:hypothetical protein
MSDRVWFMMPHSLARTVLFVAVLLACRSEPLRARARDGAVRTSRSDVPEMLSTLAPLVALPSEGSFRVERAAAAGPNRVFAVADERLWHTVEGRWVELPIAGASVRDVASGAGTLWVLARGEGPNVGRVIVLRAGRGDDLSVAVDFLTAEDHDPRALAVASDHEFYVGGANPSLLRVRVWAAAQMNVYTLPAPVEALTYMPDAMMALRYVGGTVAMFRWGETMAVERPGYLFSFPGARESLMTYRDGSVYRGRVWELPLPNERLSSASGITPIAAATLRDERVVEIDAEGRSRMLRDGRWIDVEGPRGPTDVVTLAGARALTEGSCVRVDRDGSVYELVDTRWERRIPPP